MVADSLINECSSEADGMWRTEIHDLTRSVVVPVLSTIGVCSSPNKTALAYAMSALEAIPGVKAASLQSYASEVWILEC